MKLINILRLETPLKITIKMYVQIQDGCHMVGQITLKNIYIYYAHLSITHHYSPVAAL